MQYGGNTQGIIGYFGRNGFYIVSMIYVTGRIGLWEQMTNIREVEKNLTIERKHLFLGEMDHVQLINAYATI
jgi:hypothetical protein